MMFRFVASAFVLFTLLNRAPAQDAQALWKKIAPHFEPPAEFAKDLGGYKSPLLFNDGSLAKTPADWAKRRSEIHKTWTDMLGRWPDLSQNPKYEIISKERRENFTQMKLRIEIAPGKVTDDAYLLVPDGPGPFPAAVVVYYDAKTGIGVDAKSPLRDFAYQLVKRGFVALSFGSTPGTYYPSRDEVQTQSLSFHAYEAAVLYQLLASLGYVDATRIGIVGHSYGGKWAMFASCLFDRFACAAWSDGGVVFDEKRGNVNYWEPWYLGWEKGKDRKRGLITPDNPRIGLYKTLMEKGHDLHELHALMAPRPFLVSGGAEDPPSRWQALNHARTVNKLLGHENRVAMTNRPMHSPNEESNQQIYDFFEYFLKAAPVTMSKAARDVKHLVGHRGGAADCPENTLASYRRAIELGATVIEVDVRTTKDGVLVSSHDADVSRCTNGKGKINDLTFKELRQLDAGSKFDAKFAKERIPTLREILELAKGNIDVLLDFKEDGDEYAQHVAGEVVQYGDPARTILGVRSVSQARQFRKLLPKSIQIGLIPDTKSLDDFLGAGVELVRLWDRWLTDETLAARIRKAGAGLHLNGTNGSLDEVTKMLRLAPASICCDDVGQLVRSLKELGRN